MVCTRSGCGVVLLHVLVGGALEIGALGDLRHGLDLVEQAAQEDRAGARSGRAEGAFGCIQISSAEAAVR